MELFHRLMQAEEVAGVGGGPLTLTPTPAIVSASLRVEPTGDDRAGALLGWPLGSAPLPQPVAAAKSIAEAAAAHAIAAAV